ncbi:hypothetical protein GCM10023069_30560 [Shinella granuli]
MFWRRSCVSGCGERYAPAAFHAKGPPSSVMLGLDPSIHATSEAYRGLDPRVKPEDDARGDARDSFAG